MQNSSWVHTACRRLNHIFLARKCQPPHKHVEATPVRNRTTSILRSYLKSTDNTRISICLLNSLHWLTTAISYSSSSCCAIWMSPSVVSRASADWITACQPTKLLCLSCCQLVVEVRSFSGRAQLYSGSLQASAGQRHPCSFSSLLLSVQGYVAKSYQFYVLPWMA